MYGAIRNKNFIFLGQWQFYSILWLSTYGILIQLFLKFIRPSSTERDVWFYPVCRIYYYYRNTCGKSRETSHKEVCSLVWHGCNYNCQRQQLVQECLQIYLRSPGYHILAYCTCESQSHECWKRSALSQKNIENCRSRQRQMWSFLQNEKTSH